MNDPTDPKRSAVALAYKEADAAPRVVAKGRGLIADEIIARAREHGIFVHESPELVGLLMQIDLDDRIPPQLYAAIAELLAWLYVLESGNSGLPPPALSIPAIPTKASAQ
jgi:flagellar biosynthesis protein